MSVADVSGLTATPSPGSVRSLQALPEVLSPVRHGFLWKRSRAFKTWLSRWFQLDDTGFTYAASPKLIKREGRYVLPSAVREVLPLPPERYRNGATMYGVRVVATSGATKDLYTDDAAALEAWARDLARSTPAARQAAYRKALMAAPPAGAPPLPPSRRPGAASSLNELHLSDLCEVDWSGMLGSGLFACVLRGRLHEGGEAVAVKIIKKEAMLEYSEIVYREAQVWSAVGVHPHICQLKQVMRSSSRMYFIAELCDGGGLVERLAASATYCEREVAWLMRQLLAAVAHLHQNAIVHMDIKPENVVFATRREDSLIKLIDFSLAAFFYTPTDPGGTPDFVAPELLNAPDAVSKNGCGPEVDMWALGVMLFFLLSGQTPFQSANLETVMARVKSGEWNFHGRRWALVSEGARDLVSRLLKVEPSQRLTAEEALEHPWLNRPEALSQALLQDAITSFRAAAAAQQQQMRTSWVKQISGELTGSHATGTGIAAGHSNHHLSPHASLNRQAMMQAMAGAGSSAPPAALLSTGGLVRNLMGTHQGMDPAAVMNALISDRPGSPLIRNSPSQSVMLPGGPSGRASRATGHTSNSPSMPAAMAAAAAAGVRAGSRNHSFSVGGGGPAHMSRMGAGGLASGPVPAGGLASGTLVATLVAARSSAGSPHNSPHNSPHHSGTGTAGGAGCSPRSPLGMRTRRASDTMAYAISLTERQESFTQMQAQGLAAPPNAGMQWPAAMAVNHAKARRASDVHSYGLMPYNSASQAELGSTAATAGAGSGVVEVGSGSAGGAAGAGGHSASGLPPAGAGSSFGLRGSQQRGASGLSVMTNASTSAAAAAAAAAAMRAGGRSNPELLSNRQATTSSAGAQSNNGSSSEITPHTSSRDVGAASGPAALLAATSGYAGAASSRGGGSGLLPPPPPSQSQLHLPTAVSAPPLQVAAPGEKGEKKYDAGGGDRSLSRASLTHAQARFAQLAGKSQSYHTIPSAWVVDAQAQQPKANVRPLSGAHGYGSGGGMLGGGAGGGGAGSLHPSMAAMLAAGGGSARGTGTGGLPGGGGVPTVAMQRRASMSFTAGTSGSGLGGPHGPSPLSNSSAGRIFPPGTLVAAVGAGNSMPGIGSQPPSGTVPFTAGGGGGGSSTGGGMQAFGRQPSRNGSGASTPLAPSPSHSQSNVPFQVSIGGGVGGGAGGGGASGVGMPGSTSMYAAVLRSNLSGHALLASSGDGGGGSGMSGGPTGGAMGSGGGASGSFRRATATGAASGTSTPRSCGSPMGSGTQPHALDGGGGAGGGAGPTVSQATAAVAGSMMRTTSSGSLSGAGLGRPRSSLGMGASGVAALPTAAATAAVAHGAPSLRADSGGNTQQLMEQVVLGPLLMSSGSNLAVTGSSAAGGGGFVDHASTLGSGSIAGGAGGAGSGVPSGVARDQHGSNSAGVGSAAAVLFADGSSALRPAAWSNDTADASVRERVVSQPPGAGRVASFSAADSGSSAVDGMQQPRFSSGPHASVAEAGGSGGGSPSAVAAAAAAGGGGGGARAAPSIADMLRSNALGLRASSRLVLETIPSEDPESLSGLLRSVREERAAAGGGGGGATSAGGPSAPRNSGSNLGGIATHAAIVSAANLPSGPISSTAISLGPMSGPPGPAAGGVASALVQLPSMPSETSDDMVASLRSGMASSSNPARLAGAHARSAPAAAMAAAALLVVPPQDVSSGSRESPASGAGGGKVRAAVVSSRSGSVLHRATSALGAGSLHSGGSGFGGGLSSAPHRSTSLNEEALRHSEGGTSGDRSSGGSGHSGHSGFGRQSHGSANGASPLGSPVAGRGAGPTSGGSGSGKHVRRATTAVNLRLHATTAAAAQAALAAEKAALAAEHGDGAAVTGASGARAPHSPGAATRAPHSPPAAARAPHSPTTGSSPRAAASKPPATKTVKEEKSSSSESGSDDKAEPEEGKPDPFAHWDWPPPAPAPLAPRAPAGAGHRQRAASAVGLSGASLAALLAQAAPLAQAAQASAAAQIESIYSSSGGGSFTSQRAHGPYGPPGSIRAAGALAGLGHGSEVLGPGSGGPGTPHYPGDDGSGGGAGGAGGPRFLNSSHAPGYGHPSRNVRRAATASNMGMLVCTASGGIAPAADEDVHFAQNAAAAALRGPSPGVVGGGSLSQVVMPTTSGGGFAASRGGGGSGASLHGQVSVPAAAAAQGLSLSGAESPVQPPKTRSSAAGMGGGSLAALLAQAAPLAAAAQANAAAQTAARMASNSSTASMSPAAVAYGVRAAAGSGPSTPTGHNTLAMPGGGNAYFGPALGQGAGALGSGSGASAGSYEHQTAGMGSWSRRRSSTSKDLRDRATAVSHLPAGGSAVHRLGQNPAGVFAGLAAAGGSSGGMGAGAGSSSLAAGLMLATGSTGGAPDIRGVGLTGGAVGGVQPRLSQSPPRDQGSPGGASVSSAGRLSTYPAIPSRLSHSGTGTNTPRIAGAPSAAAAAASTAGAVVGPGSGNMLMGAPSPALSPQSSLNRLGTVPSAGTAATSGSAGAAAAGGSGSGAAPLLPQSLSMPAHSVAASQTAAAAQQIAQLTQLHHLQNQLHQQSQLRVRTSSRSGSNAAFAPPPPGSGGAVSATGLGTVGSSRLNGDRLRGRGTSSGGVSPSHSAMHLGSAAGASSVSGGAAAIPGLDKDKLIEAMEREIKTLHGQLGAGRRSNTSSPLHSRMSGGGSAHTLRTHH